jgi:Protein of unknown function DUF115
MQKMSAPAEHDPRAAPDEVLVWGLGSGRRVRALLREGKRVEVLAIDVDPARPDIADATVRACPRLSEAERDGRLRVLVAPPEQLAARFSMLADHHPSAGSMHVDLAALSCVPEPARDLARVIERLWTERADLERFAPRLHANLRDNLEAIAGAPSLERWRDAARGRPGFVLAAGPSAAAALPWLAHARTLGPLIAVDTCLPLCRNAELSIDCLASVDPHASSRVHLQRGTQGVGALAFQPYCAPAVVSSFGVRMLGLPAGDRLCDRAAAELGLPAFPVAGTVLLFALQIAALLGCDPIVMVGADFAHVGGLSHAEGTATARALTPTGVLVSDCRGRAIPSSSSLLRFKGDVEQHIAASTIRHLAIDGGGAAIAGTRAIAGAAIERWVRGLARHAEPFSLHAPAESGELEVARNLRAWRRLLAEVDAT